MGKAGAMGGTVTQRSNGTPIGTPSTTLALGHRGENASAESHDCSLEPKRSGPGGARRKIGCQSPSPPLCTPGTTPSAVPTKVADWAQNRGPNQRNGHVLGKRQHHQKEALDDRLGAQGSYDVNQAADATQSVEATSWLGGEQGGDNTYGDGSRRDAHCRIGEDQHATPGAGPRSLSLRPSVRPSLPRPLPLRKETSPN